jgi:hypothetical protein
MSTTWSSKAWPRNTGVWIADSISTCLAMLQPDSLRRLGLHRASYWTNWPTSPLSARRIHRVDGLWWRLSEPKVWQAESCSFGGFEYAYPKHKTRFVWLRYNHYKPPLSTLHVWQVEELSML